jgi:hypothetical protein
MLYNLEWDTFPHALTLDARIARRAHVAGFPTGNPADQAKTLPIWPLKTWA